MKHVRKLLVAVLAITMAMALAGCGNKEQKVTLYNSVEVSGVSMEHWITFNATGDAVNSIGETSILDLSAFTEEEVAAVIEGYDQVVATYQAIEGVDCTGEYDEAGSYTLSVSYSTDKETMDAIAQLSVTPIQQGEGGISLKASQEAFEAQGYTIVTE